jgi:hypothetical protein
MQLVVDVNMDRYEVNLNDFESGLLVVIPTGITTLSMR